MTRICLIAGNGEEAYRFARLQSLSKEQWFYPKDANDLLFQSNFHVIVVGTAGFNFPAKTFERLYEIALERGKIGRI